MFFRQSLFVIGTLAVLCAGITGCSGGGANVSGTAALASRLAAAGPDAPPSGRSLATVHSETTNAYVSDVLQAQPLTYYQLNDPTSSMTDSGNHRLNGSYGSSVHLQGATITTAATSAAVFPGGSSYNPNGFGRTSPSTLLQPPRVSLEAWIELSAPNATAHDLPIVVYGSASSSVRYGLFLHGLGGGINSLLYTQHNVGQPQGALYGGIRLVAGPVYHVVVTFDGITIRMYVNGIADMTLTYSGSIDYSPYFSDGLQIGGANQIPAYASASFPGTIAQVAVYPQALTQQQITSHFLAGQIVPMITEQATASDVFVDSIGINTHFERSGSIYVTQYAQVKALLVASGIRHLRESMIFNAPWYVNTMKDLAASGVRASYGALPSFTEAQVQSYPSLVGDSFEQFEGVNEPDLGFKPGWVQATRSFQQNYYSWVKGDPAISKFPVIGPALTGMESSIALGDISAYEDAGNIHDYFGAFEPGTAGWGGTYPPYGCYGSIAYNVNLGRLQSGSKPIMATETGYGTIAGDPLTLDYRTDLRYMTRLFFDQFNGGIMRSYPYELLDEGPGLFNNFGILQINTQPKPSYYGIKSLIAALADPGAPFSPSTLTFQLTGFNANVRHTLLQKRNGDYVLAVWIEMPGWITENNAGGDIIVPGQIVTLATTQHFRAAAISAMDDSGKLTTTPMNWNGQSASFEATDRVTLITLSP